MAASILREISEYSLRQPITWFLSLLDLNALLSSIYDIMLRVEVPLLKDVDHIGSALRFCQTVVQLVKEVLRLLSLLLLPKLLISDLKLRLTVCPTLAPVAGLGEDSLIGMPSI